jgi:hypothetical protein
VPLVCFVVPGRERETTKHAKHTENEENTKTATVFESLCILVFLINPHAEQLHAKAVARLNSGCEFRGKVRTADAAVLTGSRRASPAQSGGRHRNPAPVHFSSPREQVETAVREAAEEAFLDLPPDRLLPVGDGVDLEAERAGAAVEQAPVDPVEMAQGWGVAAEMELVAFGEMARA